MLATLVLAAGLSPSADYVVVNNADRSPRQFVVVNNVRVTPRALRQACFGGCGSSCGCQATQGSNYCPCSGAARAAGARERVTPAVPVPVEAQPVMQFRLPTVQSGCANGSCGVVQTRRGLFR